MRWIVDGNNVMGARADGWWRDRAAAAGRLADELDLWQRGHGEPVIVVFDGPEVDELTDRSRPGFSVRCSGSRAPDAADDVIVGLVDALYVDPDLGVVTSDAGLVARLPPGVHVEGAGRFLRRLGTSASATDGTRGKRPRPKG
ncbi:MAG: NYN domain-containing protein [Acidimicrobiales bacterium]|nr:NYN domain-containing protein [Acidimicrobiales bacterium]